MGMGRMGSVENFDGKQKTYTELGTFQKGKHATSELLAGFTVNVTEALSQEP
jgi:hypothetical protein